MDKPILWDVTVKIWGQNKAASLITYEYSQIYTTFYKSHDCFISKHPAKYWRQWAVVK